MSRDNPPLWMFCCDPGLVSGVGILRWTPEHGVEKVEAFEGSLAEVGEAAEWFLGEYDPTMAEVVAERFVITPRTGDAGLAGLVAEGLRGAGVAGLEALGAARRRRRSHYQSAGDAKRLVPNPVLHAVGIWHRGGAGHANDALRHGVYRYATGYGIVDAWDDLG